MRRGAALAQAAVIAAAAAWMAGCGPRADHVDFVEETNPPANVTLAWSGIAIPEGIAVAVTPTAMSGGERMDDASVSLESSAAGVLGVQPTADGGFVIYGARAGIAQLTAFVDGDAVGEIPARVTKPAE